MNLSQSDRDRYWSYVNIRRHNQCWPWIGAGGDDGYGRISINGRSSMASRVMWEISYGEIPEKARIHHICNMRSCQNPTHLFIGLYPTWTVNDLCRFWDKINITEDNGCWEWTGATNNDGYGQFGVHGNIVIASRSSWEIAHGPIPHGLFALHRCDNPKCCNHNHLFLGTKLDNAIDRDIKGRSRYSLGESHYKSKLTEADVLEIRLHPEITTIEYGKRLGVSQGNISCIRLRKSWKHIYAYSPIFLI
jgi:hypothetical protein